MASGGHSKYGPPRPRDPGSTCWSPSVGYLCSASYAVGRAVCAEAWNFGPDPEGNRTVGEMLALLQILAELAGSGRRVRNHTKPTCFIWIVRRRDESGLAPGWSLESALGYGRLVPRIARDKCSQARTVEEFAAAPRPPGAWARNEYRSNGA